MRIVASYNIKGGVGKTTTIVNIAHRCAFEGYRSLVWDMDPQGAASFYFRVKAKVKGGGKRIIKNSSALEDSIKGTDYFGLDILPSDFSYRNLDIMLEDVKRPQQRIRKLLSSLEDEYDFIFMDCAPSISLTSESILFAAQVVLIPTIPTVLSLRTLDQLSQFCLKNEVDTRLIPFFSMVDQRKEMHRDIIRHPPTGAEPPLETWIPYNSQIEKMGLHRAPVYSFDPNGIAAKAYENLWRDLLTRIETPIKQAF